MSKMPLESDHLKMTGVAIAPFIARFVAWS